MARFTTSDGLSLEFEDSGSGLPLLCLPGLTRNARDFYDLNAVLPDGILLFCLTSRVRGAADWDPAIENYAVPVEARDALELLDHLGLPRAAILGTSRGGLISMLLALTSKDRLMGVMMNDIGPEIATGGLAVIYDYIGKAPAGKTYAEVGQALKSTMGAGWPSGGLLSRTAVWPSATTRACGMRCLPRRSNLNRTSGRSSMRWKVCPLRSCGVQTPTC